MMKKMVKVKKPCGVFEKHRGVFQILRGVFYHISIWGKNPEYQKFIKK